MSYFKAELFRHKKIKSYKFFTLSMVVIVLMINIYMKMISPMQENPITSGEAYFTIINFFMMGVFVAFPIISSAYIKKSSYVNQQIISNRISVKNIIYGDAIISSLINFIIFTTVTIATILIVYSIFGNNSSLNDNYSLKLIEFIYRQVIMLFAIITLGIQADCLQKVIKNKVLASGIFLFIAYILPIMALQLRFFSNIIMKISRLFPMSQVAYSFRDETNFVQYFLVFTLNIVISLILCNLSLKNREF